MPARRTKNPPKVPLRPNTSQDEEQHDETYEVPDKQFKQQELASSPKPPTSTRDNLTHVNRPATPTTPYKPHDFVKRVDRSAAEPHTHGDIKIFSSTYRKDVPQSKSMIINVFVRNQEILKLRAYSDDTIEFLKLQIESKGWIPADKQRLNYKGKLLEHDSFQLSMYEITDQAGLICHEA